MIRRESWYREALTSLDRILADFVKYQGRPPGEFDTIERENAYWGYLLRLAERETRVIDLARAMEKVGLGLSFLEFLEVLESPKGNSVLEALGYLSSKTTVWPRVTLEELRRIPERFRPRVKVKLEAVAWEDFGEPTLQHTLIVEEVDLLQVAELGEREILEGWDPDLPYTYDWLWVREGTEYYYAYRDVTYSEGKDGPYIPVLKEQWDSETGERDRLLQIYEEAADSGDNTDYYEALADFFGLQNLEDLNFVVDISGNPAHKDLLRTWQESP